MTLGIFGDSYTRRSNCDQQPGLQDLSWPEWLVSWGITVGNHGLGGSGLWYTYCQFLEHHHRYDRVVVTVTEFRRQPIRGFPEKSTINPEYLQKDIECPWFDADQRRTLRAARDHMLWAQAAAHAMRVHELLVQDLQQLRPDALFIPCFRSPEPDKMITDMITDSVNHFGGLTPRIPGWQGLDLFEISDIDHQHFRMDLTKVQEEYRHCHMNEQNNRQFAQEIISWLQHQQLPLQDITVYHRPQRPRSHYFAYKD